MVYDPTDERYRKPRRFRNLPAQRYIQLIALSIAGFYGVACICFWKKNLVPYLNIEHDENELAMAMDYNQSPLMEHVIDQLRERQRAKREAEAKENKEINK